MSLRSAFKAKFKSFDSRDGNKNEGERDRLTKAYSLPDDDADLRGSPEFKDCVEALEDSRPGGTSGVTFGGSSSGKGDVPVPPISPKTSMEGSESGTFKDIDEKAVYELQLTQLQEQLVAAMIENQNLAGELKQLKDKSQLDKLLRELEFERERNAALTIKINETKKKQSSQKKRSSIRKDRSSADSTDSVMLGDDWVDMAQEVSEDSQLTSPSLARPTAMRRIQECIYSFFYELIADFTEEDEVEQKQEGDGDPLTVKQLKENIKRFYAATKPIVNTTKGVQALLSWKTPSLSVLVLTLYLYSVWHDWLLPLILFLFVIRLSINFLRYKGLNINIHYLQYEEDKEEIEDKDFGVSDKFSLVLQVAKKVQNGLGQIADTLEKLKNLLTWKQPAVTAKLYGMLCLGFALSSFLPGHVCCSAFGLYLGFKLFIIDYVFKRFPRVRQRHDTVYQIWQQLPTDTEMEKRNTQAEIDRYILPPSPHEERDSNLDYVTLDSLSSDDRYFLQLFSLPLTECPLPAWTGGRRCTLINREKSLTSAFKNGKLYLTRSFICFERSKTPSPKNLVIPLADIVKIDKAKPYSWMPGGGMALEIQVAGVEKPFMFGALLNRDEAYESVMLVGRRAGLAWVTDNPHLSS